MNVQSKTIQKRWDVVIIGSGFGGSLSALQLARAGLDVLLLERGDWVARDDSAWDVHQILVDRKYKAHTPFEADQMIGRGMVQPDIAVGGSSVFYGAASLRLRESDFQAHTTFGDIAESNGLSFIDWPVRYDEFASYYDRAEAMLDVAGESKADPCEPPREADYPQKFPRYSKAAQLIADAASSLGLQPFPLPLAINYHKDHERKACVHCTTCDLFPCKICAKNDLSVTILPQAIGEGAVIRPNVVANRLVHHNGRITAVACVDTKTGDAFQVACGLCIVSAGAIGSAKLLLASGLNQSKYNGDLVGRYLLRHCNGIVIGIFPFETNPERRFNKQVAITDFYFFYPERSDLPGPWGMIQALQVPPAEYIQSQAPPPISTIGAATTRFHSYLLCIAEDLPNPENRVKLHAIQKDAFGSPIASVHSQYHKRDKAARRALYREGARILRKAGAAIRVRKPINTYSHAIGTCRFGSSPESAVLDPYCNFFGIKNLFVVDGSFMPTAGGVNPSLTIAANALRVSDYVAENWQHHVGERKTESDADVR